MIVIINQNGEDPPIVQQQQQDKHRGHGQSGAEWPHIQPGRRKRVVLDQTESELRLNSIFGHRKLSISFLLRLPPHRTA